MHETTELPADEALSEYFRRLGMRLPRSLRRELCTSVAHYPFRAIPPPGSELEDHNLYQLSTFEQLRLGDPNASHRSQVIIGEPCEVVITLDVTGHITIAEFAVAWHGHTPISHQLAVGCVTVERRGRKSKRRRELTKAIRTIRRNRLARYKTCTRCGEANPPEWCHGDDYCQGCAQRYLGVVY